ncbi:hypothetical protein, partial [Rheinheimera sp.]|uniref:hypothetical protein n=1 Tax=Rheinheimera sp. TaxID=1869214 RepID=UPI003AF5B263
MALAVEGFQSFNNQAGVAKWSLDDIAAFINLYESKFHRNGSSLAHYVMVQELWKAVALRTAELS